MAGKKKQNTAESSEKKEEKKAPPASKTFMCVIQQDIDHQMQVFRWLINDPLYQCIYILHDKDVKVKNPSPALCKDDEEDRYFDNSERVKPHYHMIVRIPKKCSALTLEKRFGCYVHFMICSDPFDYSYYLTHEVFRAREKHRYDESEICGDMELKDELRCRVGRDVDFCRQWQEYMNKEKGVIPRACALAVQDGNGALIRQLKSHGYFYEKYFSAYEDKADDDKS